MHRTIIASLTVVALAMPVQAAGPVAFDRAWREQGFPLFSGNSYRFGGNALEIASDGAVSIAWRSLPAAFHGASRASWRWSVSEGVPPTDLTRKGGDDRNLALYFVFVPQDQAASVEGAGLRRLLRNPQARVLVYAWGGSHARGAVLASPYLDSRGKTVVLRGAGTGSHAESVDLAADLRRVFGEAPRALVGMAVSGDSDDTSSRIRASISALRLD